MGGRLIPILMTATLVTAFASHAWAGDVCQGPTPGAHAAVHGPVLAVPDGSSLCVATGVSPSAWIRIPLDLQTTRAALMAAAFGKNATCAVDADGRGACTVEGKPLAEAVHSPEIVKAAYDWR